MVRVLNLLALTLLLVSAVVQWVAMSSAADPEIKWDVDDGPFVAAGPDELPRRLRRTRVWSAWGLLLTTAGSFVGVLAALLG